MYTDFFLIDLHYASVVGFFNLMSMLLTKIKLNNDVHSKSKNNVTDLWGQRNQSTLHRKMKIFKYSLQIQFQGGKKQENKRDNVKGKKRY